MKSAEHGNGLWTARVKCFKKLKTKQYALERTCLSNKYSYDD